MSEDAASYGAKQYKFKEGDTVECTLSSITFDAVVLRCRPILAIDAKNPTYDIQSVTGDTYTVSEKMLTPKYGVQFIAEAPKAGDTIDFQEDYIKTSDGTITTETIPDNVQRFREITGRMAATYAAKNADYGNSFTESVEKYGPIAGIVRLSDKFKRAENLILNKSQKVSDESIIDTLIDAACYNIMLAMEIEKNSL